MQEQQDFEMSTLLKEWGTAQVNRRRFTTDFPTLDKIVDGVPIQHQPKAPFVGDTTIAGLTRQIPRASLRQLPTFSMAVNGTKESVTAKLCTYFLRRSVFNENTFGKGLLSTMQIGTEQAIAHGYAPFMVSTGMMANEFGTTMQLLHWDDVDPEPGVRDSNEFGYIYLTANITKSKLRKILKAAEANENTSWNVPALQELVQMDPSTKIYSIYGTEARNKNQVEAATFQFITRYEPGGGGRFVTFCPQIEDRTLRTIENRSKFGYPKIVFLVIDPEPLSPFGVSRVRLASPFQNMLNIYLQNIASMLLINSKPPVLKRGRFDGPVQLVQGAQWNAMDQNATAELVTMDNGALSQASQFISLFSTQIQNIMGATAGALGTNNNYSKTGPGVRLQEKDTGLSTTQITNILENFLRQYALTAVDTHISEQTGDDILIVDDECKDALNEIEPGMVGDDNKVTINWEEFYDGIKDWTVEIELSMDKDELEEKTRGEIQDLLTTLAQTADPADMEAQAVIKQLRDKWLQKTVPDLKLSAGVQSQAMMGTQMVENAPVQQ